MTKKEFKNAMCRGLGRCYPALQNNPEKYRDLVMWACKRDIAYDTQCEGTRAFYVYRMACVYGDVSPFVKAAAESLIRYKPQMGWKLSHLTELLCYFAEAGNVQAKAALDKKYHEIYDLLMVRKRRMQPCFCELWDMERFGVVLAVDWESSRKILSDFGRLYAEKSYFDDGDFAWLYDIVKHRYAKQLRNAAKEDPYIAMFLKREKRYEDECSAYRAKMSEPVNNYVLSRKLARNGTQEEIAAYARAYHEEQDPQKRREALIVFRECPYPDDPAPIIEDALSQNEDLAVSARMALAEIRHPAVKQFALEQIKSGKDFMDWFDVILRNYENADEALLYSLVEKLMLRGDQDGIHHCGIGIMNMFDDKTGDCPPNNLLPILYEATPCAECRYDILRLMGKRRMLTEEVLTECLDDSNDDIRNYAKKLLARRKKYRGMGKA